MKKIIKLSLVASILAVGLNASLDVRQRNAGEIEKAYHLINKESGSNLQLNRIELKLNIIIREMIKKERKELAREKKIEDMQNTVKEKASKFQNWVKEKVK
jgi:hypothetical protein